MYLDGEVWEAVLIETLEETIKCMHGDDTKSLI